ncbi:N-acetylmuramoyl-L-alanine amidase, partial [Mesorhizobium sp. M7A.F.Ca.CA.001.14.1.1]|uniref:AMIN domain-containing protein n=1 Tax=Mesorhizobium sp. M7A.F.Ca.CA.001.14.1.1 TaxID=2496706 RepID=UPI000FD43EFD
MGLADFTDKGRRVGGRILAAFCLLLLLAASSVLSSNASAADAPLVAKGYKMAGDATKMRIVMDFDREPDIKWFLLRGPNRLVIDLANTRFAVDAKDLKARGLVKGVRLGELGEGVSRLILTGKGPFAVDKLDVLKNEDGTGYRIAIDMSAASEREFDAALANQALTTGSTVSTDKGGRVGTGPVSNPGHRFTVVIDPGHGGIDGGAAMAGVDDDGEPMARIGD